MNVSGLNGRGMSVEAAELIPAFSTLLCIDQTEFTSKGKDR